MESAGAGPDVDVVLTLSLIHICASNDIEQATKLARTMITRYGMSPHFDMMALETVTNQMCIRDRPRLLLKGS